jgi:hypothetical protein
MITLTSAGLAIFVSFATFGTEASRSDGIVRYPLSERLSPTDFRLDLRDKPSLSQSSVYHSADGAVRILGWYARQVGVSSDNVRGALGACQTYRSESEFLLVRQAMAVTLCSQRGGTLIFVNRTFAIR